MTAAKVIAIDGPAYVGKSQIAQGIAKKLGYEFINTGHMYRALARRAMDSGIDIANESALLQMPFDVWFENGRTSVSLHEKAAGGYVDWTDQLDRVEIVQSASEIAKLPRIREKLTRMQRAYAQKGWIVMEGRDIGTVVFPDAEWKFFITASEEVRAKRLLKMQPPSEKGKMTPEQALNKIRAIDDSDLNRKIAPLRKAGDAIEYHNDAFSVEQDIENLYKQIKAGKKTVKI